MCFSCNWLTLIIVYHSIFSPYSFAPPLFNGFAFFISIIVAQSTVNSLPVLLHFPHNLAEGEERQLGQFEKLHSKRDADDGDAQQAAQQKVTDGQLHA